MKFFTSGHKLLVNVLERPVVKSTPLAPQRLSETAAIRKVTKSGQSSAAAAARARPPDKRGRSSCAPGPVPRPSQTRASFSHGLTTIQHGNFPLSFMEQIFPAQPCWAPQVLQTNFCAID